MFFYFKIEGLVFIFYLVFVFCNEKIFGMYRMEVKLIFCFSKYMDVLYFNKKKILIWVSIG